MAALMKITRIRGGHRADVTKRLNKAKELLERGDPSSSLELEALHTVLLQKYTTLKELDQRILDALTDNEEKSDDDLGAEISDASDFEVTIQTGM